MDQNGQKIDKNGENGQKKWTKKARIQIKIPKHAGFNWREPARTGLSPPPAPNGLAMAQTGLKWPKLARSGHFGADAHEKA